MTSEDSTVSNVFLVTADSENFDRTVRTAIEPSEYSDRPGMLADHDQIRLWGARSGTQNERYWEAMHSGDLLLFYTDGTYVGLGRVGKTFEDANEWVSSTFWNDAPSSLIYTVERFREVSVPKRAVNRIFEYSDSYNPQGLMRVADERVPRSLRTIERAMVLYDERNN